MNFPFEFLSLRRQAFGLDLSDLSFKVAQLSRKGKFFHLDCAAAFSIPQNHIEAGEIKDIKGTGEVLREGISKIKKLRTNYVVCSLPEEQAFLQAIQMPRMQVEEVKKAILFEAENYIPLSLKDVYLDFEVIQLPQEQNAHMDILIVAVPKRVVDSYLICLEEAQLRPVALEVESFAVARALVKGQKIATPVLLLDLGATRTGFSIFCGASLRFTASIPVSGRNFSEAIAKSLNTGIPQAEDLKMAYGLAERKKKIGKEVFGALMPVFIELTREIRKYLEYYKSHFSHEHLPSGKEGVERVYLCGGGANLKGFPSLLASELKLPVELGNPWTNILPDPIQEVPEISREASLVYTTALGLALRGVQ